MWFAHIPMGHCWACLPSAYLPKEKPTTEDMLFTLETVSCLGACGLAPVLMVNETVYPSMTPEAASALIKELRGEE